jgi:hypothetical protein
MVSPAPRLALGLVSFFSTHRPGFPTRPRVCLCPAPFLNPWCPPFPAYSTRLFLNPSHPQPLTFLNPWCPRTILSSTPPLLNACSHHGKSELRSYRNAVIIMSTNQVIFLKTVFPKIIKCRNERFCFCIGIMKFQHRFSGLIL